MLAPSRYSGRHESGNLSLGGAQPHALPDRASVRRCQEIRNILCGTQRHLTSCRTGRVDLAKHGLQFIHGEAPDPPKKRAIPTTRCCGGAADGRGDDPACGHGRTNPISTAVSTPQSAIAIRTLARATATAECAGRGAASVQHWRARARRAHGCRSRHRSAAEGLARTRCAGPPTRSR